MNKCHVYHPEHSGEDKVTPLDFSGNKPSVPPLTTEEVASIVYEMEDDE